MIYYGTFQRGETVVLRLGVEIGSIDDATAPRAYLKPVLPGRRSVPNESVSPVGELTVEPAEADETGPAGWTVTAPAALTEALPPGRYVTDLRLQLGGGVWKSEPVTFTLVQGVTS